VEVYTVLVGTLKLLLDLEEFCVMYTLSLVGTLTENPRLQTEDYYIICQFLVKVKAFPSFSCRENYKNKEEISRKLGSINMVNIKVITSGEKLIKSYFTMYLSKSL